MKKKLIINADVCDARTAVKEVLSQYESIKINADCIIMSESSKIILAEYPVSINASEIMMMEDATETIDVVCENGNCVLSGETSFRNKVLLTVNGNLTIEKDADKALDNIVKIIVNGNVIYPSTLRNLPPMVVNGSQESYPGDAVKLKSTFLLDKTFLVRCRNQKYYAKNEVIIADETLDMESLLQKGVQFITQKGLLAEKLFETAALLFDEDVELDMIPEGYYYSKEKNLTKELLCESGGKIYIDRNFMLKSEDEEKLQDISLIVRGGLHADETLAEKLPANRIKYKKLWTFKKDAVVIADRDTLALTEDMLHDNTKGIAVIDCDMVSIDSKVPIQELKEKVQIINCSCVMCGKEQKGTVEALAEDCSYIHAQEEYEEENQEKEDAAQTASEQNQIVITCDFYKL
ncbi:MAG: hypothetical protein NC118_04290 [Eubacterium sp.]|nr:hypothetical protein [Eubacterium sp.]